MALWIADETLAAQPTSGAAWEAVVAGSEALLATSAADLDNQDEKVGEYLLAAGIRYARTGHVSSKEKVYSVLARTPESENGGRTLALGRNLASYVLAADFTGYREASFVNWLSAVRRESLDGMTLISTHEGRPNNWGTACGASRIAAALYLGDEVDLGRCAKVFKGWLGDRDSYAGFKYGDLSWQADPAKPVGVNPKGAFKNGINIDGCLPDDQRRTGGLTASPPAGNYVRAAISHSFVSATLLWNAGFQTFDWSDQALKRAVLFFRDRARGTFSGDDAWVIPLVEWAYPELEVGADVPGSVGKTFSWAAYTHGAWSRGATPPDEEPPPPPPPPPPDPDPDPTDPCASVKADLAATQILLSESVARENSLRTELADASAVIAEKNAQIAAQAAKISNAKAALA